MGLQDGMRMFDDLKSRLGFGSQRTNTHDDRYYDDGYDDGYGDYDEFSEYADDYGQDGYDDGYDSFGERRYSGHGTGNRYTTTTRPAGTGSRVGGLPRLLSIDDVRAGTRATSKTMRESRSGYAAAGNRALVDSSLPYSMTPEGAAAVSAAAGLGSRQPASRGGAGAYASSSRYAEPDFSNYAGSPFAQRDSASLSLRPVSSATAGDDEIRTNIRSERSSCSLDLGSVSAGDRFGARDMAGTEQASTARSIRDVQVLKPQRYSEAERITQALKKGDAVVMDLHAATNGLDKRILDFSFGAANALNAEVECIADKVFAIAVGKGLTDEERNDLHARGVI